MTEPDRTSDCNNCLLKVAELSVMKADVNYVDSIKIYEQVAEKYLENKLTAPSSKDLFFRSCLLFLANDDAIGATSAIEKYSDKDPGFLNTRECKFIQALITAIEKKDVPKFSDECFQYNQIVALDKWKTNILSKVKALIQVPEGIL